MDSSFFNLLWKFNVKRVRLKPYKSIKIKQVEA